MEISFKEALKTIKDMKGSTSTRMVIPTKDFGRMTISMEKES